MSEASKKVVTMKLDSEDYENIFLRVRGKLIRYLFGIVALLFGGSLAVIYPSVASIVESGVERFVQTDSFRDSIAKATTVKADDLHKRLEKLEADVVASEKRVAALANLPINVGANSMTIVDQRGNRFTVESGLVKDGETVSFVNKFQRAPIVLLSVVGNSWGRYDGVANSGRKYRPVYPEVEEKGFRMPRSLERQQYTWVALGQ